MSEASVIEISLFALTGLFVALWYLLTQKDAKQQKDIELLWQKHDADAKELDMLKLQIASRHYEKNELDNKFDRMEETFRSGFKDLGSKVDTLTNALLKGHQ